MIRINTSGSNVSATNSGPITSWNTSDTYAIRKLIPPPYTTLDGDIANNPETNSSFIRQTGLAENIIVGSFLELDNTLSTADRSGALAVGGTTSVTLAGTANANDDFYVGGTIRMNSGLASGEQTTISSYNGTTNVAILSPGFVATAAGTNTYIITKPFEARRITKYVNISGTITGSGVSTSTTLGPTASNIDGDYNNLYIRITSGLANGDIRLLQSYTVVTSNSGVITRTATPFTAFSANVSANDTFEITSGIVSPAFSGSIAVQSATPISFAYDNLNPFNYSGSLVSQQQEICYDIELINLVVPNETLVVGEGDKIINYPYLYIELRGLTSSSAGVKNIIHSNNPNSSTAIFRVPVDDLAGRLTTSFIKFSGDGMKQSIKFKPDDNMYIKITLPCGDIYETTLQERFSPNRPNPFSQISGIFSFKKTS